MKLRIPIGQEISVSTDQGEYRVGPFSACEGTGDRTHWFATISAIPDSNNEGPHNGFPIAERYTDLENAQKAFRDGFTVMNPEDAPGSPVAKVITALTGTPGVVASDNLAISELNVARYRGLREEQFEGFGRINLFVGPNNSGKTSVLESIALFARPLDFETWVETVWRREVKSSRVSIADALLWMFPRGQDMTDITQSDIWIEGKGRYSGRKVVARHSVENILPPSGVPSEASVDFAIRQAIELDINADFEKWLPNGLETRGYQNALKVRISEGDSTTYSNRPTEPSIPLGFIDACSHRVEATVHDLYSAALRREGTNQDFKEDFVRILQRIDPDILRLELVQSGRSSTRLVIKHRRTGVTPLSAFGDGVRRALLIAVMIPTLRGGVLLIDELEAALHVSVLGAVLSLLRWAAEEFQVQIFATTHSLEALDSVVGAFRDSPDSLVGFRLDKSGGSNIKRFPGSSLRDIRMVQGLDVR